MHASAHNFTLGIFHFYVHCYMDLPSPETEVGTYDRSIETLLEIIAAIYIVVVSKVTQENFL